MAANQKKNTPPKTTANAKSTPVADTLKSATVKSQPDAAVVMPLGRMNYILLIAGIAIIAIGFFLMSREPFIDATQFSLALNVAPIVVVAGFLEIIYAIMYRPKSTVQ